MKKVLFSFIFFLAALASIAQYASWNSGANYNWNYSFAGGLHSTIGGSFAPNGSAPLSYVSTPTDRQFLPSPVSGDISVRSGASGRPVYTIDGTTDALKFQASPNTNIGKFSLVGVSGASALTSLNFTVNFDLSTAEWLLAMGSATTASTKVFGTSSNFTGGSAGTRDEVFSSFRWSDNGGTIKIEHGYQAASGTASPVYTLLPLTLNTATNYKMEFLANNTASSQAYTKNSITYTIPTRSLHFWVNDVQVPLTVGVFDFPASVLATNEPINSFMLQGRTTAATATISALNLQLGMSTLPVSLIDFAGRLNSNSVELNWKTASENNNSHFDILRYASGSTPVKIGEVKGKGNSSDLANYHFTDAQAMSGTSFYQLRQVDFDGKAAYSQVITIKNSAKSSFKVYQSGSANVKAAFSSEQEGVATLSLSDMNGRVLSNISHKINKGENIISLYNKTLVPGIYIGRIAFNETSANYKVVVR